MSRDILLGVVIGAQGLKGEVKIKTFTERPEQLGAYGPLHAKDGRKFTIRGVRATKADVVVAQIGDVGDRNAAETLKGVELFVDRGALPPTADDEFYHADIVGLPVFDGEDRLLGTVSALHNFGAGDVILIAQADGSDLFLPFTREVVPIVDLKEKRIVVIAPEETEAKEDWS